MSGSLTPTQAGFLAWVQGIMQAPVQVLSPTDSNIATAFALAMEQANPLLSCVGPNAYQQAVYNLAGDILVNIAVDLPGQTFWADLRTAYDVNAFLPGVLASTGNESTSESMATPEWAVRLQLGDLQNLKTPWGRAYLAVAQRFGGWMAMV